MGYWHEPHRVRGRLGKYSADMMTRQVVQRSEENPDVFEVFFIRQTRRGLFPTPEDAIELWPLEPITAPTAQDARDKALTLLEIAAGGEQDDLFEKRPVPIPIIRKKVSELPSPTHKAIAWIIKHSETRYEVRYFGDLVGCDWEEGWRLQVPLLDGELEPAGCIMLTIADSLESAQRAATDELLHVVAGGKIKPR